MASADQASYQIAPDNGAEAGDPSLSTQNTQYNSIGKRYRTMNDLDAIHPERPSVIAALGNLEGKRCLDLACGLGRYTELLASLGASSVHGYDISPAMVDGAKAAYPASTHPNLHFSVADCSKPENLRPASSPSSEANEPQKFDLIFAGWFLNYAGTEHELTSMFKVIEQNLVPNPNPNPTSSSTSDPSDSSNNDIPRFVGITTNVHDPDMTSPKPSFYGLDILVLDPAYVAPDTGKEVGIKARVVANIDQSFHFDVFQFRKEVYERCARDAGLRLVWREPVLPDDERREGGFWDRWLERPTMVVVEAVRL